MVKKLCLFLSVMLFVCSVAPAQNNHGVITGIVSDSNGLPLAGASVVIDSLKAGVATGNHGRYALRGLNYGRYALRISFTGFEPFDTVVVVNVQTVVDASLKEALFVTDEVIVRSSRAGSRTPMAHSTIVASEIRARDMTRDMPYLLLSLIHISEPTRQAE